VFKWCARDVVSSCTQQPREHSEKDKKLNRAHAREEDLCPEMSRIFCPRHLPHRYRPFHRHFRQPSTFESRACSSHGDKRQQTTVQQTQKLIRQGANIFEGLRFCMHSLMSSACAIESRIAGSCSKFSRLWLSRTTSRQKEWNLPDIFCFVSASRRCYMCRQGLQKRWVAEDVFTLNACLAIIGHNFPTRSCISLQALLVNVRARICSGRTWCRSRSIAMRIVSTRVLLQRNSRVKEVLM
jgi:hypothetical protein